MKKFVLRLDLLDDKEKRKALKTVSTLPGIDLIAMDMKQKKLTVVGTVDPVKIVSKLRKFWPTDIILVGPAKEPEPEKKEDGKKEEEKKDGEAKKEEPNKDGEKKEGEEGKKDETKKEDEKKKEPEPIIGIMPYRPYYAPMHSYAPMPTYAPVHTYQYAAHHHSVEENPNGCVIS